MTRVAGRIAATVAILIPLLAAASPALALDEGTDEGAFPAYAVARLKVLDGSAWVRQPGMKEWEEFESNSPVPPRSRISVPEGSEAELQFHGGQFVLLTPGTDLELRDMKEASSAFRLRAGEIRFDLPRDDFAPVSVRLPGGGRARFAEPGRYWLTVTEEDETVLVVRRGRATVTLEEEHAPVKAGEQATIGRGIDVERYRGAAEEAPEPPESAGSEPAGDAPPAVVNELREYGEWIYVPAYGYVWRPRVAAGWSPYVYGRWVWISPYGWTWVSNEPWGWYPYRCGYWLNDPVYGWFWSPYGSFVSVNFYFGSYRHHHHNVYFRPATVRFIPEGRGVRWVPLRPGERYRPAEFRRGDPRLVRWNRPLEEGRVFVRGGANRREWRDWKVVHTERQVVIRKEREAVPRVDTRTIRPERPEFREAPKVRRQTVGKPVPSRPSRDTGGKPVRTERGTVDSKGKAPAPKATERERVAPRLPPSRPQERGDEAAPKVDRPQRVAPEPESGRERTPSVRSREPEPRGREDRMEHGDNGERGGDRGRAREGGRERGR